MSTLNPLIQTLRELVEAHETLLALAERKRESLIADDLESLSLVVKEEGKLVKRLGKLEEERVFQLREYVHSLGLATEAVTLSQLIQLVPHSEEKSAIQQLADSLQEMVLEVKRKNELNTKLIQDALHFVNQSIDVITDPDDDLTYQDALTEERGQTVTKRSFFDTKA